MRSSIWGIGALPFAVVKANGELVDVHDVLRGKACACVCPGCLAPVVAKQGEVNVWHFAHEAEPNRSTQERLRKSASGITTTVADQVQRGAAMATGDRRAHVRQLKKMLDAS